MGSLFCQELGEKLVTMELPLSHELHSFFQSLGSILWLFTDIPRIQLVTAWNLILIAPVRIWFSRGEYVEREEENKEHGVESDSAFIGLERKVESNDDNWEEMDDNHDDNDEVSGSGSEGQ
jgi:hypothetical protein